jgi:hypothetical protein
MVILQLTKVKIQIFCQIELKRQTIGDAARSVADVTALATVAGKSNSAVRYASSQSRTTVSLWAHATLNERRLLTCRA